MLSMRIFAYADEGVIHHHGEILSRRTAGKTGIHLHVCRQSPGLLAFGVPRLPSALNCQQYSWRLLRRVGIAGGVGMLPSVGAWSHPGMTVAVPLWSFCVPVIARRVDNRSRLSHSRLFAVVDDGFGLAIANAYRSSRVSVDHAVCGVVYGVALPCP